MGFVSAGVVVYGTGTTTAVPVPARCRSTTVSGLTRGDVLQPGHRSLGQRRCNHGPYTARVEARLTTQRPEPGRRARRLRTVRRCRCVRPTTEHGRLRARQRSLGSGGASANASWYNPRTGTPESRHRLAMRTDAGDRPLWRADQTSHAEPERCAWRAGSFASSVGCGKVQLRAGSAATVQVQSRRPAATSMPAPTATSTRRPTAGGKSPAAAPGPQSHRLGGQQSTRGSEHKRPRDRRRAGGPGRGGEGAGLGTGDDRAAREGGAERQRQFVGGGSLGGGSGV